MAPGPADQLIQSLCKSFSCKSKSSKSPYPLESNQAEVGPAPLLIRKAAVTVEKTHGTIRTEIHIIILGRVVTTIVFERVLG